MYYSIVQAQNVDTVFCRNVLENVNIFSIGFDRLENCLKLSWRLRTHNKNEIITLLDWRRFDSIAPNIDFSNVRVIEFKIDDTSLDLSNSEVELNEHWNILSQIFAKSNRLSHVLFIVGNEANAHQIRKNQTNNLLIKKLSELLRNKVIDKLGMIIYQPIEPFDLSIYFPTVTMVFVAYNGAELLLASKNKNRITELSLFKCRNLTQAHIIHLLVNNSNPLLLRIYTSIEDTSTEDINHDITTPPPYLKINSVTMNDKEIVVKVGQMVISVLNNIVDEIIHAHAIQVLKIEDANQKIFYALQAIMRSGQVLPEMTDLEVYHGLENINFKTLFRKDGTLQRFSYMKNGEKEINSIGGRWASCEYAVVRRGSLGAINYMILCTRKRKGRSYKWKK